MTLETNKKETKYVIVIKEGDFEWIAFNGKIFSKKEIKLALEESIKNSPSTSYSFRKAKIT